ncbi:MAG TPA: tetratricopeptide repeat protein [Candidatus Angelobacter sp.]|jgi:tetratricopeptide (TPR) repeat protein
MKTKLLHALMVTLLFVLGAGVAWPQATSGKVKGTITSGGKPVPNAQVILTSTNTGKTYKMKTDRDGSFAGVGITFGEYEQEIQSATGEKLYKRKVNVVGEGGAVDDLTVDIGTGGPTVSKEEMEKLKAEREKGLSMNALINQYNTAQQAKNWQQASDILKQMIAAEPNRWEYQKALGDMQMNLNQYDDAVATYEKVIPAAEAATKNDPKADPAKTKATLGQIYANEGNAYLKIKKNPEAIAAFTKAAELDPNPAIAYFNLCATQYNTGNTDGALAACDKAIAADPNKADAYYIKGSLLMGGSTMDKQGKLQAPAGTAEALNKYLEIAPTGPHADDVKQMLAAIGAKVQTTYNEKGNKKK